MTKESKGNKAKKLASGGLAQRAEARTRPTVSGLPAKGMNIKARYKPRLAEGGAIKARKKEK